MKTESNIFPSELSVERCANGTAEVIFRENIVTENRNGATIYTYDEYRTVVPYRENLLNSVTLSKEVWLERAKKESIEILKRKPTLTEQVAALKEENAKLRKENDTIGAALEETIALVMGGVDNG